MYRGFTYLSLIMSALALISCGGGTEGYQEYGSVAVGITQITPTKLESDVMIKKDFDEDGICDSISFKDDTVVATLNSIVITPPDENYTNSPILVDRYRITFINASSANNCEKNESCKILFSNPIERFINTYVEAGGTTHVTLSVIPIDWKSNILINYCLTPFDSCVYNVVLEIHAIEVFSGKDKWLKATFSVQIADYIKSNSVSVDNAGQITENSERDDDCTINPGG